LAARTNDNNTLSNFKATSKVKHMCKKSNPATLNPKALNPENPKPPYHQWCSTAGPIINPHVFLELSSSTAGDLWNTIGTSLELFCTLVDLV
jgi:hypothetical protein